MDVITILLLFDIDFIPALGVGGGVCLSGLLIDQFPSFIGSLPEL